MFAATFVVGTLADLYGVPGTSFKGEYGLQQEEIFRQLNLVADLKKERLLRWIKERKTDAAVFSESLQLIADLQEFRTTISRTTQSGANSNELWTVLRETDTYQSLATYLAIIKDSYRGYESVDIVEWNTGVIIASSSSEDLGQNHPGVFAIDPVTAAHRKEVFVSNIETDHITGTQALHFGGIIRTKYRRTNNGSQPIGILVLHVNPDQVIRPIMHTGSGLGRTGEVFLVNHDRELLTHLNHLLSDGSEAIPLKYRIEAIPATLAAQGKEGLITSDDYRGEPVLAAYRHLRISSEIGWGMVVKMDQAEAFVSLHQIFNFSLVFALIGVLVGLGLIFAISRNLSRPITRLGEVAREVEAGNLAVRITHTGGDELGLLGRAFNAMIERVQHWRSDLEQQVTTRTSELESKNVRLKKEVTERKRAVDILRSVVSGTSTSIGDDFFRSTARHLAETLEIRYVLIGAISESNPDKIITLALWAGGQMIENIEYDLAGTPCENVAGKTACYYPKNIQSLFPDDKELVDMAAESYLGQPLFGVDGQALGIIALLDDKALPTYRKEEAQSLLTIFAGRVAAEIERRRSEEALRESEEKFRHIAERAFDVIVMINAASVITYSSPSVETVLGYDPGDVIGRRLKDILPRSELSHLRKAMRIITAGNIVEGQQFILIRKDGLEAVTEVIAVPLCKGGRVIGAQAIIRDITETTRLRQLKSRAERLETAGQIAGQVAHDFNNLLAPLMAYPEFIRDELPKDHATLPLLKDIEHTAQQMAEINQQLLTLGRRGHYNQEPLDLNSVIRDAVKEMQSPPDSLIIKTVLCDDLMHVMGGRSQILRAISNLIYNAQDALGGIGQITITTENFYFDEDSIAYGRVTRGEYVKITIADTGHGIPSDFIQRIFDPFFTTKTTDKQRGSGLGLSVVDAVVKDHNGYIDLSSQEGKGTSFYLYFPITRTPLKNRQIENFIGGSETVLVVDDDHMQREVTLKLLAKLGYAGTAVASGEEAITYLSEDPQDIMILDMIMPGGMDGAETYQRALEINPNQKAIIVSGFAESERVQAAVTSGAGAFIKKPLSRQALARAIREELDRKQPVTV